MISFFLILSWGFAIMSMGAWIFPHTYFSELVLSFLPYILFLGLVFFSLFFLFLWQVKTSTKPIKKNILIILFSLTAIFQFVVIFTYLRSYLRFYMTDVPQVQHSSISGYKVLYANIYKDNQNYTGLKNLIEDEDPDLIFFVEFADHHSDFFKKNFAEKYPYSNRTSWSKQFIGSVVFSKVPITNWADDFPQGAWRYGYFSVDYQGTPIYFYLVHMSSPSSLAHFDMRNQQIQRFFQDFDLHKQAHRSRNDKVVVLGDFNTTPRSIYYREFAQGFAGEFINVTRDFPTLFTWRLMSLPFMWAQIDHVFVNNRIEISDFSTVVVPGSDHRGFHFVVR